MTSKPAFLHILRGTVPCFRTFLHYVAETHAKHGFSHLLRLLCNVCMDYGKNRLQKAVFRLFCDDFVMCGCIIESKGGNRAKYLVFQCLVAIWTIVDYNQILEQNAQNA